MMCKWFTLEWGRGDEGGFSIAEWEPKQNDPSTKRKISD